MNDLIMNPTGELDEFSVDPVENPKRPDISHLPDAVSRDSDGTVQFDGNVGDTIVADVSAKIGNDVFWLITRSGTITSIDSATGSFWCWDAERGQNFGGNFKTVGDGMTIYKLVPRGQKVQKRRRKKKGLVPMAAAPKNTPPATTGEPVKKRGRGRPPGSKNRPKAVIEAERKQRLVAKAGKKIIRKKTKK